MRSVGVWPASAADTDEVTIDFSPNLGAATITGTPVVVGVNCTASWFSTSPQGQVTAKYSAGVYAGEVQITVTLSDGRTVARSVGVRFL